MTVASGELSWRMLRLDKADVLSAYLGLRVVRKRKETDRWLLTTT